MPAPVPTVAAVVLSMGNRPAELARSLDTLLGQRDVELDIVVVGNGWVPKGLPAGVRSVALPENVGVPEGRNVGAAHTDGDLILFYDDDATLPTVDVVGRLCAMLQAHPEAAIVQPRLADPTGLPSPRRWVPRLRAGTADVAGEVGVFCEGIFLIRRSAFEQVGGWAGHFFFAHEGVDLAWRLYDAGWRIRYEPSVVVHHPATPASRHAVYYRTNARNRVWLARRNLPLPVLVVHLVTWTLLTLVRVRSIGPLRVWFSGFWEGVTTPTHDRHPMRWRTVLALARVGRPPVV